MAGVMVERVGQSLPQQHESWGDIKAAYRLLSNDAVDPAAMLAPHQALVRQQMLEHAVVLCVHDDSDVTAKAGKQVQHTSLAVLPDGTLLGVLDARWFERVDAPEGETRLQREARWRESCIWSDAARGVGPVDSANTRLIHVCDRAADDLDVFETCVAQSSGFVIRARHDRNLQNGRKLWEFLQSQPAAGTTPITIGTQRDARGRITRAGREAQVTIRFAPVELQPPHNHPGAHQPQQVWAVYLREEHPPAGAQAVEWMLLTSEPVKNLKEALVIIGYYRCRWIIEEFHRCLKEGCGIERAQLDELCDIRRLSAILSVVATRLLQLRDLAESDRCDSAAALKQQVPPLWIALVSVLAKCKPQRLTPKLFWHTLARRGGWIGRKSDPRPGWKVIWRGYYDLVQMANGVELWQTLNPKAGGCG
jgi:hypothetical protein